MERIALEIAKKFIKERKEFFENAEKNLKILAKRAKSLFSDAKVFVFGSYAKGNYDIYLSDIDVLIVSEKVKNKSMLERAEMIANLRKNIKAGYIFQIHLVSPKEFEIYKKFIDKMREIG